MKDPARLLRVVVVLSGSVLLAGCHGARPASLGVRDGRLAPCPASHNCVSSLAPDEAHRVAPSPSPARPRRPSAGWRGSSAPCRGRRW